MYEGTAKLKAATYTADTALNQVPTYTDREVYVKPRSVYANDFYQAAQAGLKPELVLVLACADDYQGEKLVEYNGTEYTIIRAYHRPERDSIELTLEERTENG